MLPESEKPEIERYKRPLLTQVRRLSTEGGEEREERQDAVLNRQRVLEAARRLFAERGVEAVTMKDIAEAAGVGKGTLYRRFPDKGSLCLALVDQAVRKFQAEVLSGFGSAGQGLRPLGRLELFLTRLVEFTEQEAALLKPAKDAGAMLGKEPYYSKGVYDWQKVTMMVLLREVVAAGESRPDLDLDYLADALLAPLQIDLYLYQRQVRGYSPARITTGILQLLRGVAS